MTDEVMLVSYPQVELFGGFSYMREDSEPQGFNLNGWNASVAYNINRHVAVRADFSGYYKSEKDQFFSNSLRKHQLLFGPQFSVRPNERVRVFLRPLFGLAHVHTEIDSPGLTSPATFSDTAFAMALGGGLDVRVNNRLMVRLGQVDYLPTFFGNTRQDNFRFSTGVVFTFGGGNGNVNNDGEEESEELKKLLAARRKADEARKLKDKANEQLEEAEKEGIRSMLPDGREGWEKANAELEEAKDRAAQARDSSIEADGAANALKTPEAVSKAEGAKIAKLKADLNVNVANGQAEEQKTNAMTPEAREKCIKARNEYKEKNETFERLSREAVQAQDAWEKIR